MKHLSFLILFIFTFFISVAQKKVTPQSAYQSYLDVKNLKDKTAPQLSGYLLNGKPVDIKQFKDSVIVLSIWNVNCAPCINELESFKSFKKIYNGKKVVFLALNPIDKIKHIKTFIKEHPIDFTIIHTPARGVLDDYKIVAYPTNYVIDSSGTVCYASQGYDRSGYKLIDDILKSRL